MADKNHTISLLLKVVDQTGAVLKSVSRELDQVRTSATQMGAATKQAGADAANSFQRASGQARDLASSIGNVSTALMGAGAGLAAFGAALAGPMALATKTAGDFELAMNKVKAVADQGQKSISTEMATLAQRARDLNLATEYTLGQVAEGMKYLAMSGMNTNQIFQAIEPSLNLATGGVLGLGQAADIVTNIMTPFKIAAEDTGKAANTLAVIANNTNTNVSELGEAMKYAAPVASAMGMSLEAAASAMGVMANAGIKGTLAGTELRALLSELATPTAEAKRTLQALNVEIAKDAKGNVDLIETLRRLKAAHMSATDAFEIFNRRSAAGAIVLTENLAKFDELYAKTTDDTTALKRMSDTMRSGFTQSLTIMRSSLENLLETMGRPLLGALTALVSKFTEGINAVSSFMQSHQLLVGIIGGAVGLFGLVAAAVGALGVALGGLFFITGNLARAWTFLVNVKNQGLMAAIRGKAATTEETAAIATQTQAINANTVARQRNRGIMPGPGGVGPRRGTPEGVYSPWNPDMVNPSKPRSPSTLGGDATGGLIGAAAGTGSATLWVMAFLPYAIERIPAQIEALGRLKTAITNIWNAIVYGQDRAKAMAKAAEEDAAAINLEGKELKAVEDQYKGLAKSAIAAGRPIGEVHSEVIRTILDSGYSAATKQKLFLALAVEIDQARKSVIALRQETSKDSEKKTVSPFGNSAEEIKKSFDTIIKQAEAFYSELQAMRKADVAQQRAAAAEVAQSDFQQKSLETDINSQALAQRLADAQKHYANLMALRSLEYQEAQKAIEKLGKSEQAAARQKLDKEYADTRIADERKYTQFLVTELNSQLSELQRFHEQRRELLQKQSDAAIESEKAVSEVYKKSLTDQAKLRISQQEVADTLRRAMDALPTMPEKAIALAQQARQLAASTVQDINGLINSLTEFERSVSKDLADLSKKDKTPYEKWLIDLQQVKQLQADAAQAAAEGDMKQAAALAQQARAGAKALYEQAPAEAKGEAEGIAAQLFDTSVKAEREYRQKELEDAKKNQELAAKAAEDANKIIQDAIARQVSAINQQIAAIEKNTAALQGKIAETGEAVANTPKTPAEEAAAQAAGTPSADSLTTLAESLSETLNNAVSGMVDRMQELMSSLVPQPAPVLAGAGGTEGGLLGDSGTQFKDATTEFKGIMATAKEIFTKPVEVKVTVKQDGDSTDRWG